MIFHHPVRSLAIRLVVPALLACLLAAVPSTAHADETEAMWTAVRLGEAVAIMRHALAPGNGDPAGFKLGDCSTQRNLSDEGRRQAVDIGQRFRDNGIERAAVYSSGWCRCRETAELLDLGPVETLSPLNSFFSHRDRRDPQTKALQEWLSGRKPSQPLVLVTHQVNITALTGTYTGSGDIVVVRQALDGGFTVLGKL